MADPFLFALVTWLQPLLPSGLKLEIEEAPEGCVQVNGHGAWISPEQRRDAGRMAARIAEWLLDWVQDDVAEDVAWGTPWPARPDGQELPRSKVEIFPDGVVVGYIDRTGWILRFPRLPLPETP